MLRRISAVLMRAWYRAIRALEYVNLNEHLFHSTSHFRRRPYLSALISQEQSKRARLRQASRRKQFPHKIPGFAAKYSRRGRFAPTPRCHPSRPQTARPYPLGYRRPRNQSRPRPHPHRPHAPRFRLRHRHERRRTHSRFRNRPSRQHFRRRGSRPRRRPVWHGQRNR